MKAGPLGRKDRSMSVSADDKREHALVWQQDHLVVAVGVASVGAGMAVDLGGHNQALTSGRPSSDGNRRVADADATPGVLGGGERGGEDKGVFVCGPAKP